MSKFKVHEVVFYKEDNDGNPIEDANGNVIPNGPLENVVIPQGLKSGDKFNISIIICSSLTSSISELISS